MNYQHAYHAGNIADVFKHVVLVQLLCALQKKSSGFSYIETHAGRPLYNLTHDLPQKTLEYQNGILTLWNKQNDLSTELLDYLNVIHRVNPDHHLKFYPGSSYIAKQYLRAQDEAILCELHPAVYQDLHHFFYHDKQVHVHHRDGYEGLTALIPPKTKRGLVLIDPPYEIKDEYTQLISLLNKCLQRWKDGIYVIWFPIKEYQLIVNFYQELRFLDFNSILAVEFWAKNNKTSLQGSGLVLINPPWQFDQQLSQLLPQLVQALGKDENHTAMQWLIKPA